MEANVQNHDFSGSATADTSDHTDLNKFLESKKVDTTRYEAVGAGFSSGHDNAFSGFIVCKDNQKSVEERDYLIRLYFEDDMTRDKFFSLFKRFEVLITSKHDGYGTAEMNGELVVSKDQE